MPPLTSSDSALINRAAGVLDSVAANAQRPTVATAFALLGADCLVRVGAQPTSDDTDRSLTAQRAARVVLRMLAKLSPDALANDAVLDAIHATQRLHAAAN